MGGVFKNLLLLVLFTSFSFAVGAQTECGANSITQAQYNYDIGRFTECLDGLKYCLDNGGYKLPQKIAAYSLGAKCYLALDSISEADRYIQLLLSLDDNYQPQDQDPQRFRLELAYVRIQTRASRTSSVSKKAESIDMAPATMQVITAKDIENRGYLDIESIFNDLPGFDISRDFGISYSVLYQRGYRAPALTERTMIMIDGVENNDLWGNAAYISKQYPISSVKRVEVIYGPASNIYGANAFCGVINIVTKDEDDLILGSAGAERNSKPKTVGINMHTGVASYHTRFVDGTAGVSSKKVFFSVTGRAYFSDGVDLSSEPYWDGVPTYGDAAYTNRMSMKYSPDSASKYAGQYYQVNGDSTKIVPTVAGIRRADSLDKAFYKIASKNSGKYEAPIQDFYISAKLAISHFKFGFQYWNKNEGASGDFVDNFASTNAALTNWQVRDYFVYARYDNKISERVSLTSFTYYRYMDFGDDSRVTTFSGYGNGALSNHSFMNGVSPYYARVNFYQASNILRSELKSQYIINDKFDVLAGAEFTSGILQANYITTTLDPAVRYGRAIDSPGGNNFTTYTVSGYATAAYHNTKHKLNIDIGGRLDNNRFRGVYGYGTVFNPRMDVIWYPGKFIFKAIYAEAFLNASNQNKFSTTGSRLLNNPDLEPEKVQNYELSARYRLDKRSYIELAGYRSDYSHLLSLVSVPYGSGTTQQYRDLGKSVVYGCQAASEVFIDKHLSIYANVTFTSPQTIFTSSKGADSSVRTGDIATFSGNAGVNVAFFRNKFNLNTRVNYVGDKPTGKNTSVASNPFTNIPGYALLNATLGYRIVNGILIQVGCNNIADNKYYTPGVRTADGNVYAPRVIQPGRNYMARLIFDLKR
jgi:outer membrane receptor for ferrienterochelin and colicins